MSNQKKGVSTPFNVNMIDEIDKNIHEPSRLRILAHLFTLEHTDFTYLKNLTEFSWGRLSSHLDKLEQAGYVQLKKKLVTKSKNGKETPKTFIYLTEKGKQAFTNYRKSMKILFS
ncbi:MAG: transcriptional regulator [Candidatus Hodarchaeales archaeon]|jgi:DNA-binding MarR family transcriptional regulator